MTTKDLPKNPVEVTLKMMSCRWKTLIIKELLNGTMRFNELKRSLNGITQKVLSAKLKELESDGIVQKRVYEQIPPKVEYSLTDVGLSLHTVICAMHDWGKDYKKYRKLIDSKTS